MSIIWQYLDKRGAAIKALKDYNSMRYIINHTSEEIAGGKRTQERYPHQQFGWDAQEPQSCCGRKPHRGCH